MSSLLRYLSMRTSSEVNSCVVHCWHRRSCDNVPGKTPPVGSTHRPIYLSVTSI